jgi:acyl-CoA synthetase (AMP-forming)/AMP-acid ligase II
MIDLSLKQTTLVDLVINRAAEIPETIAFNFLTDGENQSVVTSYAELDEHARAIAAALQSLKASGKQVLLVFPPGLEYIKGFFGCLFAGAVAVPTYPPDLMRIERSMPRFLSIIRDAQPFMALTTGPILAIAQMLADQYPELKKLEWCSVDSLIADSGAVRFWSKPEIDANSLAFLQYTSGSTSQPKGVMLTYGNLMNQLEVVRHAFDYKEYWAQTVFWLPFYHDMGLIGGILGSIYFGMTNLLLSPLDFLQRPFRWLQAISRTRATISGGPNFAYELCIRKISQAQKETLDLSSWTLAFNGAEPVRAETLERFTRVFEPYGFCPEAFYPCYGLAEATLLATGVERKQRPFILTIHEQALARHEVIPAEIDQPDHIQLVSCGKTWLDHQVVIVDPETLQPILPNEMGITSVGEIWFSGPCVAQGYWNRPEETQRTFLARLPGYSEHFLRTGDYGFVCQGELFVTGRVKDLIIIDGLNHYPQDIELTVEKCHPGLRPGGIAAFSIDVIGQEQLVVVAEVTRGTVLSELAQRDRVDIQPEKIMQAIRKAVSAAHDLAVYQVVLIKSGSIPKTSSGKIQRHACKIGYLNGTLEMWQES